MKRPRPTPKKYRTHVGEDGMTYRVKPWAQGIIHGFVIEVEGEPNDWTVLALFYMKEESATEAMLSF